MRKVSILFALLLASASLRAQSIAASSLAISSSAPSGNCGNGQQWWNTSSNVYSVCGSDNFWHPGGPNPLDNTTLTLYDEFVSTPTTPSAASGWGALNWFASLGSSGTITSGGSGDWNHPGLVLLTTSTVNNSQAELALLNLQPDLADNTNWDAVFVFKLSSTSNVNAMVGTMDSGSANGVANGCFFRYWASFASDTAFKVECIKSGTATVGSTTFTADTNYHRFEMKSTTVGQVQFALDGSAFQTISTNVPTSTSQNIAFSDSNAGTTTTSTVMTVDKFGMVITGLSK